MMCDPTLRCQTLEDRIALYERRVVRTWKIVGVGTDGGRVVLDRFVTRERAHELRQMLLSCEVFREVLVERDQDRPIGEFEMAHTSGQVAGLLPGTNDHHHS